MRGDDDTCSLPTTTWSGQQARTPIAVRRLGPLPTAPSPHHPKGPSSHKVWLVRIAKLAAVGAVVAVSAAGVIKVRHTYPASLQACKISLSHLLKQVTAVPLPSDLFGHMHMPAMTSMT